MDFPFSVDSLIFRYSLKELYYSQMKVCLKLCDSGHKSEVHHKHAAGCSPLFYPAFEIKNAAVQTGTLINCTQGLLVKKMLFSSHILFFLINGKV